MLVVNIHNLENGVLVRCSGRIVAGEELGMLRTAALANLDAEQLVLDLNCVTMIDGAGLGLLASLQGSARSTGCHLRIHNPSVRVRELLELTNLDSVLDITPSREFAEICDVLSSTREALVASACAH